MSSDVQKLRIPQKTPTNLISEARILHYQTKFLNQSFSISNQNKKKPIIFFLILIRIQFTAKCKKII